MESLEVGESRRKLVSNFGETFENINSFIDKIET